MSVVIKRDMGLLWLLLLTGTLACTDSNKVACKVDTDCRFLNDCDKDGCCTHKDLMPLADPEAGGTILIFVIAGMANAGGIGGGPIMTSFELILFYFETKQAIPLSQVIITAGAVISLAIRILLRHPTRNRPLLDYHVSMLIIPPILFGSVFGVMANKVLPNWSILAMLTIVLIFLTYITLKNGIKMYRNESKQREIAKKQLEAEKGDQSNGKEEQLKDLECLEGEIIEVDDEVSAPLKPAEDNSPDIQKPAEDNPDRENGQSPSSEGVLDSNPVILTENKPEISEELRLIYLRESKQFPLIPWVWIIIIVIYVALGLSIRGGSGTSFAGISFCGEAFKIFFAIWSFFLMLLCLPAPLYLLRLQKTYERLGYDFDEFDIKWTVRRCIDVSFAGLAGGFGGGLLGFGASLIVAPILVQWKMRSPVVGPTAALMTLIGSAISVMQFAESKSLVYDYAGWYALIGFTGSMVGVISVTKLMKKLGRNSLLVFILAIVLGIAMFLVPIYTLIDIIKKEKDGKGKYGTNPYCT